MIFRSGFNSGRTNVFIEIWTSSFLVRTAGVVSPFIHRLGDPRRMLWTILAVSGFHPTGKASKSWYFVGWTWRYCWSPLFEITICSFGGFLGFRTNSHYASALKAPASYKNSLGQRVGCTKCCQNIVSWSVKVSPYVANRSFQNQQVLVRSPRAIPLVALPISSPRECSVYRHSLVSWTTSRCPIRKTRTVVVIA